MNPTPLYFVWDYNDTDRAFWAEHLEPWLPSRIIDAHVHVTDPALRREPMTEAMRRQYWVNEVFECLDGPAAEHCYRTVFPGRETRCLAFGFPDLAFDLEGGNDYAQRECQRLGWLNLAVIRPQWSPARGHRRQTLLRPDRRRPQLARRPSGGLDLRFPAPSHPRGPR